jgi:L-aminopeptidase/D-esterase-like protein
MITEVEGIRVGHHTNLDAITGCTVVLCPAGTVGSGEVRGGAPGTRETDLLRPGMLVEEVNAVLLTGGSAFGLAAADGVVRWLEERGIGHETGVARVPIVPAAVLFDLWPGDPSVRPDPSAGYAACEDAEAAAASGAGIAEGSVGAGTGATVAKTNGLPGALKGGIGTSSQRRGDLVVGALVAVNALGDVLDEDGEILAGSRSDPGDAPEGWPAAGRNTTLAVVATNAKVSKERAHLLSLAAHEGMDNAIRPSHTLWDGDTAFALATGGVAADQREIEEMAALVVADSIRRAVRAASSLGGVPAVSGS